MDELAMDDDLELEDVDEGESVDDHFRTGLIQALEAKKEQAVSHKCTIESRWIQDERQYWGLRQFDIDEQAEGEDEVPPVDNKTGEKVELAAARIGDMLFPTNDPNWQFDPPDHPEDIYGQPVDIETARQAVKKAQAKVEEFLTDCQYAKHGRKAIHDACRLGVGVIKGPYPRMSSRRVVRAQEIPVEDEHGQPMADPATGEPMVETVMTLQVQQESNPASTHVDPWMFFPNKCRSMEECDGAFEMHRYSPSRVVQLAQHEGFDQAAVRKLASQAPSTSEYESSLLDARDNLLTGSDNGDEEEKFIVWEYHGPIEPDLLHALGALDPNEEPDPLEHYWGEVWFSQGIPLKVDLNAIMGDERVPYYVVPYRRDEADIINSYGIPRIMRDDQRTIDIAWEAMVHNVKLTAGPQTVHWEGKAVPGDGSYVVRGPKSWKVTDARVKSIADVIQFNNIESALPNITPLYDMAKQNANDSTQLPMLAHGEASNTVQQTASGMQMVMNSQNIVQRKFAHQWDDEVTVPMLTRYYWWLMQYGDDDSIKIDMNVDPRGASYLLVKDKQAQHTLMALSMAQQDPDLKRRVRMERLYKMSWSTMDIPVNDLFLTDEEMENQGPSAQEQMQQAQAEAEVQKAQAEATKAQAEAQEASQKIERAAQNGGVDQSELIELERERMRAESEAADRETKLIIAQMERDSRMAQAAAQENIKMADIEARFQSGEQDRQVRAMLEASKQRAQEARERADQILRGMELRRQMHQDSLKERNLEAGHDTY